MRNEHGLLHSKIDRMYRVKCREEIHLKHTHMQEFENCHQHSTQSSLENYGALVLKPWRPISLNN